MSNSSSWPEVSDAQWAANQAALALEDGRYRLAAAFANLADRAERTAAAEQRAAEINAVPVPLAGTTRDEQPVRLPIHDEVHASSSWQAELAAQIRPAGHPKDEALTVRADAAAAQTLLFGTPPDPMIGIVPAPTEPDGAERSPQHCTAQIRHGETSGGVLTEECRAGIYWRPGTVGDASTPATVAGWHHIDPRFDANHQAQPGAH